MSESFALPKARLVIQFEEVLHQGRIKLFHLNNDAPLFRSADVLTSFLRQAVPPILETVGACSRDAIPLERIRIFGLGGGQLLRKREKICAKAIPSFSLQHFDAEGGIFNLSFQPLFVVDVGDPKPVSPDNDMFASNVQSWNTNPFAFNCYFNIISRHSLHR